MITTFKIIINLIELTMYAYLAYQLLGCKPKDMNRHIIGVGLLFFMIYAYLFNTGTELSVFMYTFVITFAVYIDTRINLSKVFIAVFISTNVSVMIDFIMIAFSKIIFNISVTSTTDHSVSYYLIRMIIGIIFYLVLRKYNILLFDDRKKFAPSNSMLSKGDNIITKVKWFYNYYSFSMIIFFSQIILIIHYFYLNQFSADYSMGISSIRLDLQMFFLSIGIISINILIIFMSGKVQKMREIQDHNEIIKQEYMQIEKQYSEIREYKHDLNNHFNVLLGLVEEKQFDEVHNYLINYCEDINSKLIPVKTGSSELDVLLRLKINKAQVSYINVKYKCYANIHCSESYALDFISIIGNLLDNAIDASKESEEKILVIDISEGVLEYIFIIKNTFLSKGIERNGDLIFQEGFSTKGKGRGLGLKIVNKLVKKYDGSIEITNDEELFETKVALPKHKLERN